MLIDTFYVIILIFAVIKGFSRGIVVAIFSYLAIIIGLAAAIKLSTAVAGWLKDSLHFTSAWLPFLAFALVMVIVFFVVKLAANMVQKAIAFLMMGWADRVGGVLLYALIYTTVYSIVLFFAINIHVLHQDVVASSKTYDFIQPFGPKIINTMGDWIPWFKNMFNQLETFFESIGNQISAAS